jgi:hypothetical protein
VLSSGRPLVTNFVPSIDRLFKQRPSFVRTYRSQAEILPVIEQAITDQDFLNRGHEAREWILDGQTYRHRAEKILEKLSG